MATHLRLPRPGHLPQTGPVDWIRRYDSFGVGAVLRRRMFWVVPHLPEKAERILEIGYGSGVFQYELCARAALSVGVDLHPLAAEVARKLAEDGAYPALLRADGAVLPFRTGSFDAVVILSTLEFLGDPEACLRECRRVLRSGGRLICVTPRHMPAWDRLFLSLFGRDPEEEFGGGRERARRAIEKVLPQALRRGRPAFLDGFAAPYELVVSEEKDERR